MDKLIKKAKLTNALSVNELTSVLEDDSVNELLFSAADEVRKEHIGEVVHLRALVEFSNYCKRNCLYCGLRAENRNVKRFRLSPKEILQSAKNAAELGYKTVVLQSGEDDFYSTKLLCEIIQEIKKLNILLTLSIGEKTEADYKSYFEAGADRYLLRIETTNKRLYAKLHPKMDYDKRVQCLNELRATGFELGTGCLIGLPEQTLQSLAQDILFFKAMNADMVGVGPFIANEDTPLSQCKNGDFILARKVVALIRLLLPKANIPATTAMESLHTDGRILTLQSGANVVMPNLTPVEYRANYRLYPNKPDYGDDCRAYLTKLTQKLAQIGRTFK